jgi:hypothetical protein
MQIGWTINRAADGVRAMKLAGERVKETAWQKTPALNTGQENKGHLKSFC